MNKIRFAKMIKQMGLVQRLFIFGTGIGTASISLMGNVMMSDSGTKTANLAASTGMAASITFLIGGTIGAYHHTWYGLLPGTILQLSAFALYSLPPPPSSSSKQKPT
jgi:disulfide bond formation protein DsbB